MKLLFCPLCHDAKSLVMPEWRVCLCGASGGQYNKDGMTATIGGAARVFGVGNPFFSELYPFLSEEGKKQVREKFFGQPTDAWWGEYPGDKQIFRIANADGPKLSIKIVTKGALDEKGLARIVIKDKRDYTIDGQKNVRSVDVPINPKVKHKTRWDKK